MSDQPLPHLALRPPSAARSTADATELHYGLDIETDTTFDGLDPATSSIVAIAVSTARGDHVLSGDESQLLEQLEQLLVSLTPGVIVTWNGSSFDLPFLEYRARLLGVPLGLRLWPVRPVAPDPAVPDPTTPSAAPPSASTLADPQWPPPEGGFGGTWGEHRHLDGFRLFRADVRRTVGLSCGLKAMARLVGLPVVEVDRTVIHELTEQELESYVSSDARLARQLVGRRMPNAAASIDRVPLPVVSGHSADDDDPAAPVRAASDRPPVDG